MTDATHQSSQDYQTGRIYSGIYRDGERELFLCEKGMFKGVGKAVYTGSVTEVRGPLVVLDLDRLREDENVPFHISTVVGVLRSGRTSVGRWVADQIEEQTRPPLQIGWHEVESHSVKGIRRWDGRMWSYNTGPLDDFQGWASIHYIGPGSSDD